DGQIAGDGPRLEQGEPLPGGALRLVVELERALRVDDRPAAALGTEIEVDAEEERRRADGAGHRFRQARIEGEMVDGLRTLRAPVPVVDVEDVHVAGEVQLLAAQLAHPEHAEAAAALGAAALRRPVLR